MAKAEKLKLPEGYDPHDDDLKKQLHELADKKNFIAERQGRPILCCGARKKKGPGFCKSVAGSGTDHPGYGRCKFCGGNNTGPKTPEGKAKVAQNGRKHGFYSEVLNQAERDTYEELLEKKQLGLEHEIYMMKAKILAYLKRYSLKEQGAGYDGLKQWYKDGEEKAFYHAGTIEDRPLQRALETLRRLVDSHAKLTQTTGDDLLSSINQELRAASQGSVSLSWGGDAQKKEGGN
ncbi:hypothetical protein HWB91_gp64 [Bacillus phage vB_BboS-125]|uniref:Uncharacterized protein n=1 Tax=Bacillus phage vB_BboS-125 TaxID=2419618 RepID=A0A3G3BW03_9CAUD|nr:hypothetical protein HWB91_gp64 [Bacillus phage vB_BboS-125]AYP68434.1 hypothetical protein BboS125_00065 [Bacillus phage vB_BboS-125]